MKEQEPVTGVLGFMMVCFQSLMIGYLGCFPDSDARCREVLLKPISRLWQYRHLIYQLVLREVSSRYRGSVAGFGWSILLPLANLCVFVFVFGYILKARWGGGDVGDAEFAVLVFCGLMIFNFFSECVGRAPTLIVNTPNYVKKVLFPLELLSISSVMSALFHLGTTAVVFLVVYALLHGGIHWTVVWFPVVLIPMIVFVLGVSLLLASIGVFVRDIQYVIAAILPALLFLSPIFYPVSAVPERFRILIQLNPITPTVEQCRRVLIMGSPPDLSQLLLALLGSIACLLVGYLWFRKTRHAFAEAL